MRAALQHCSGLNCSRTIGGCGTSDSVHAKANRTRRDKSIAGVVTGVASPCFSPVW